MVSTFLSKIEHLDNYILPFIPSTNGYECEWHIGSKELHLEKGENGNLEYIKVWGTNIDDGMESGEVKGNEIALWDWLNDIGIPK